jgi:hypothetical protein
MDDTWGAGVGEELSTCSHNAGIKVARDSGFDSNDAKNRKGAPALIIEFIGFVIDATVVDKPTVSIAPAKVAETVRQIDEFLVLSFTTLTALRSLSGKLLRASVVVKRGRLFVCGILANMRFALSWNHCPKCITIPPAKRQRKEPAGSIPITRWCRRNVRWWKRYFEAVNVPLDMLLPKATFRQPVQGDASGIGYGALIVVGTTCYYFFGVWTEDELRLLAAHVLNINITECLTQAWMIHLFAEFISGHTVIFECDNLTTVTWLHE